jgi:hypothetical protein
MEIPDNESDLGLQKGPSGLRSTSTGGDFVNQTHLYFQRCLPLLLIAIIVCAIGMRMPVRTSAAGSSGSDIAGVFVDVSRIHHDAESNGDTWDYIWADDDTIYSFNCDGRGYGKQGRNVGFNKLTGAQWDRLLGSQVNEMDYGTGGQRYPNGSNWKVTGADSIDGVIYAFIANNWYGDQNAFGGDALDSHLRQTVNNMSLIKSTDKGLTWTRDAQTNYDHPMWTSRKFSTGFFVKYGQNGGGTRQDDQDKYVYAISNDGYWNCGSYFYLGRVSRSKIADLNPADWEFLADGKWSGKVDAATPVPGFPNGRMKCTMGSPIWLAKIRKYVTVTWFDPGTTVKWHYPENVTFAFYQADHPWGPWSYIGEKSAGDFIADTQQRVSRWYGPSLSPKFITDNLDGSVTAILTFSGQDLNRDRPAALYKNNSCPVTFYTKPQPKEVQSFNDTDARYSTNWSYVPDRNVGDYHNDAHVTTTRSEYVDFAFTGRGIEILSEKNSHMGAVEVLIDGASKGTFRLYQDPMPRLYQVEFYRNMNLTNRTHTVRILNKAPDGTPCIIDGFRVYGGTDFDPAVFYVLVNRVSGRVLGTSEETPAVRQLDRRESPGLQWRIRPADAGRYKIVNRQSGKVLGTGANDLEGAVFQQYSDGNSPNLLWKISAVGNGSFSIVNCANDMAVSGVSGTSDADSVSQFAYFGRDNQKWEIVRVP